MPNELEKLFDFEPPIECPEILRFGTDFRIYEKIVLQVSIILLALCVRKSDNCSHCVFSFVGSIGLHSSCHKLSAGIRPFIRLLFVC